ncbi:MAG: DNA mismatch repair endonuclease MutL, partial [Terriglobia bacterium]
RILPETVANKIAAGEVVERPASLVKELLENALDAGAKRVEIHVEAGGKKLIRMEDDGYGMTRDDALLAFERHATSKIRSAEDLMEIATLGFRGEALPSIASVSRVLLETRHASESAGTKLEIAGGRLRDVMELARQPGTRIEVRDLFYNTPARRKFLKSESTELGHIAGLTTHYALAHQGNSFRLTSFTNEILNVSPVGSLRERLYQIMGPQTIEQLVEVAPTERSIALALPEDPAEDSRAQTSAPVRLFGFISRPEVQRLNRNQIYFFINRRLVRDRVILHALTEAYRNILPSGVFPVALAFLEMPSSEVDVNVHPSKTEVRFRHSQFIHDFARDAVRAALMAARPMPAMPAPRVPPNRTARWPNAVLPARQNPGERSSLDAAETEASLSPDLSSESLLPAPSQTASFALSAPLHHPESGVLQFQTQRQGAAEQATAELNPLQFTGSAEVTGALDQSAAESCAGIAGDRRDAHTESFTAAGLPAGTDEFPADLRPLGQIHNSFIVAASDEGLWIIDQHVAHERVLFERRLLMRKERQVEGQRLLLPRVVELKPQQQIVFQEIVQELAANGFEAEPFGIRTVAIKAAPAEIRADDAERLLVEILDSFGEESSALSLDLLIHKITATVACHAAVKVNM